MRITFESVDRVKQIALPNMGGPHAISETCLCEQKHQYFPAFRLNWNLSSSWVSSLLTLRLYHLFFWILSVPTAGLGTSQPPEIHEILFFITNYYISMCVYIFFLLLNYFYETPYWAIDMDRRRGGFTRINSLSYLIM